MNIYQKSLFIALAGLVAFGCSYVDDDLVLREEETSSGNTEKYQVSLKSASFFANSVVLDDGMDREIGSIDFIASGRDTLLYFVNFKDNNGWIVLSGDKRTYAIIASAVSGQIDKDNLEGAALWFDDIAESIYAIRHSSYQDTTSDNYLLWHNIDALVCGLDKSVPRATKSIDPPSPGSVEYEEVLIDVKIEVISDKIIGPFIKTKWGQLSPWNDCTPYAYDSEDDRYEKCATGCVAVAGAQMLYYFHYLMNKPAEFFSEGKCEGWINGDEYNYSFSFSDPSADVWDMMALSDSYYFKTEGTKLVSNLLGYVGSKIKMKYGLNKSSANTGDLVNVYKDFGIESEYTDYSPDKVKESLNKQIPVNIRAWASRERKKFLFINVGWSYYDGHSWLIDGLKEKTIQTTYTYRRVPHPRDGTLLRVATLQPILDDTYTTSVTSTTRYWKMNFGADGSYDDADYNTAESSVWNCGKYGFQYEKRIIHNFSF